MPQIGEITVKISVDLSDFRAGIKEAQVAISQLGGELQAAGDNISDSLRDIGSEAGSMAGDIGRATDRAESAFTSFGRSMTGIGERLSDIGRRGREMGENMIDMAENMMQGITLPLALLSAGAVKASLDMSRLGSIVQANMAGVKGSIEEVQGVAERVFRAGLGKNVEDVGRTIARLKKEFNTLNQTQLNDLSMQIYGVAEALGKDGMGVLEDVIELTEKYKITSQEALDLVAAGYNAASLEGKNLSSVLKQVNGTATQMSKTMASDPTVQWRGNLRALLATLAPLGDELLRFANGILPQVTAAIQKTVNWFTRQSQSTKNLIISIGALAAILPLITMTLGALIMMGSQVISFFGVLGGWLSRAGTAISNFAKSLKNIRAGTLGWAGGITAAIGVLTLLYNTSKEFAAFVDGAFTGVWNSLKTTFDSFKTSLEPMKTALSGVSMAFTSLWNTIKPIALLLGFVLVGALVAVMAVFNGLLSMISPVIQAIIQLVAAVVWLADAFLKLLTFDIQGFLDSWNKSGAAILAFFMSLGQALIAFFTGLWNTLVQVAAQFGVNLTTTVTTFFTTLITWIATAFNSMITTVSAAFAAMGAAIMAATGAIVTRLIARWNAAKAMLTSAWNAMRSAASSAWNGISSTIRSLVSSIISFVTSKFNSMKAKIVSIFNSVKSAITSAMNAIANAVRSGFNRAVSAVQSAGSRIRSVLSSLASSAFSWGSNLGAMFAAGLRSAISRAVAAARSAAAQIKSYLGFSSPTEKGPGRDSHKWAPNLMNMFAGGIQAGIPKLQTSVTQAATVLTGLNGSESMPASTGNTNTVNIYPQQAVLRPNQLMRELDRVKWMNGGRYA